MQEVTEGGQTRHIVKKTEKNTSTQQPGAGRSPSGHAILPLKISVNSDPLMVCNKSFFEQITRIRVVIFRQNQWHKIYVHSVH